MAVRSARGSPEYDQTHAEDGERDPEGAARVHPLHTPHASEQRHQGGRRADDERGLTGARAREPFDEEDLIHTVPQRAEREQCQQISPAGSGTSPHQRDDAERRGGHQDTHTVVRKRKHDGRAVLDDAVIHAPNHRHEQQRNFRQPHSRPRSFCHST